VTDFVVSVENQAANNVTVLDETNVIVEVLAEIQNVVVQSQGLQGPRGKSFEDVTISPPLSYESETETFRITPPSPNQVYRWDGTQWQPVTLPDRFVEHRALTPAEVSSKSLTLSNPLTDPTRLVVDVAGGGGALFPGIDYQLTGNSLSWAGLTLDGILESGDRVRLIYE
jgi:hypothetical protein